MGEYFSVLGESLIPENTDVYLRSDPMNANKEAVKIRTQSF